LPAAEEQAERQGRWYVYLEAGQLDFAIEPLAQVLDHLFPDVRLDTLRQDGGGDEQPSGCDGENPDAGDEPLPSPRGHAPSLDLQRRSFEDVGPAGAVRDLCCRGSQDG